MENNKPNYPIKWEVKSHSYQIADTGDYDGYWEVTNGKDSLLTKEDYDDIEKDLQELADLLNNTYPNFTVDRSNEAALDAENKYLRQEMEELRKAQPSPRWVKCSVRMPEISKPPKLLTVKRYESNSKIYSTRAVTAAQLADIVKYDLANFEWLDEQPAAVSHMMTFTG